MSASAFLLCGAHVVLCIQARTRKHFCCSNYTLGSVALLHFRRCTRPLCCCALVLIVVVIAILLVIAITCHHVLTSLPQTFQTNRRIVSRCTSWAGATSMTRRCHALRIAFGLFHPKASHPRLLVSGLKTAWFTAPHAKMHLDAVSARCTSQTWRCSSAVRSPIRHWQIKTLTILLKRPRWFQPIAGLLPTSKALRKSVKRRRNRVCGSRGGGAAPRKWTTRGTRQRQRLVRS